MTKKYIGKLKSFDKIIEKLSIDGFYTADYIKVLFENSGTEIELIDGYYKNCLLKKEWFSEIKEIEENEVWKPKQNERYYSIRSCGDFYYTELNNESEYEKEILKTFGCWKTKEEAEKVEKSMKLYRAMKRWSFDNDNGYVAEAFKENYTIKALVDEKTYFKVYYIEKETNNFCPFSVYFSTKEKAQQCLEFLNEEKLVWGIKRDDI